MEELKYFELIGKWEINNKYKSHKSLKHLKLKGINFVIDNKFSNFRDTVYVFTAKDEVIYIGETTQYLKTRFGSYRYGFDKLNDTDNRVKIGITEHLEKGTEIKIFCYRPSTIYKFGKESLHISVAKPIEEYLISKYRPKLNRKLKK